jgi:phosphoglycerol transferase MdoB-like AlkP superfamily enzyme
MRTLVGRILHSLARYLKERAKKSWEYSQERHRFWLATSEGKIRLGFAVLLYFLLAWGLLDTELKLGLSFLFAGGMAIYSGIIYFRRDAIGLVLAGVILASVLPSFVTPLRESYKSHDWIGVAVLLLVALFIWLVSSYLKNVGRFGQDSTRRRTTGGRNRRR